MAKAKATKVKAEDLKAKTPDELNKMLVDLKKQQFNLRFQRAGGQLTNTTEVRNVRRDVARIKTVLNEQKAGAAKPAKAKAAAKPAAKAKAKKAATA